MPPKGGGKVSDKVKQKIVEDKTFGLKNKNKSKKVQQFVQQVQKSVDDRTRRRVRCSLSEPHAFTLPQGEVDVAAQRRQEKEEKAAFAKELATLVRPVQQTKVPTGADPKSVICQYFKQGLCGKGKKCKFSHDLSTERKSEKIDLYSDARDGAAAEEGMEGWDQTTLEEAVTKKQNQVQTDIICKYFIEAVESRKYGWFWNCPNGNKTCIYRHALPPGFVLKSEAKKLEELKVENQLPIEEQIEAERAAVDKITPITKETFLEWKRKKKERLADETAEEERKAQQQRGGKPHQMSGRALFTFNPDLFVDDDEAADDYEREDDDEDVVEIKEVSGTSISYGVHGGHHAAADAAVAADGGAAVAEAGDVAVQEDLFLQGDVPDLDDLDDLPDDE